MGKIDKWELLKSFGNVAYVRHMGMTITGRHTSSS